MPRDPAKLSKADLVKELREKHGIEFVAAPTDSDEVARLLAKGAAVEVEAIPVEDATKEQLLAQFGGLLDTTTEKEREKYTKEQVKRENERAENLVKATQAEVSSEDDGE